MSARSAHNLSPVPFGAAKSDERTCAYHCSDRASQTAVHGARRRGSAAASQRCGLNFGRKVSGPGRRPAPAPPPAPLIKSPATDLATLDAIPIDHRKHSFSSPTSFLHRLLLSVPSQPDRPHDCMLLRFHHRTRSTASTPLSLTVLFTVLTTAVSSAEQELHAQRYAIQAYLHRTHQPLELGV